MKRTTRARWSPEELAELGDGLLRRRVEAGLLERDRLQQRIEWAEAVL